MSDKLGLNFIEKLKKDISKFSTTPSIKNSIGVIIDFYQLMNRFIDYAKCNQNNIENMYQSIDPEDCNILLPSLIKMIKPIKERCNEWNNESIEKRIHYG